MGKLFENCEIDLENGIVKTKKGSKHTKNKDGYYPCYLYDCFNNRYYYLHEVIIAEGLQLPKHLWPVDEKGKKYVVDHITPVSNGGTDVFANLRLIPEADNHRNPISKENNSKAQKGKHNSPDTEFKKGNTPWNKGKKYHTGAKWNHSDETKKKISKIMKTKKNAAKKVYQYSLDGKLIQTYNVAMEAEKDGFGNVGISRCCNGVIKTYKGYKWTHNPL